MLVKMEHFFQRLLKLSLSFAITFSLECITLEDQTQLPKTQKWFLLLLFIL